MHPVIVSALHLPAVNTSFLGLLVVISLRQIQALFVIKSSIFSATTGHSIGSGVDYLFDDRYSVEFESATALKIEQETCLKLLD